MAHAAVQIPPTQQILAAAMELPEPDRAELVLELLRSLSPLAEGDLASDAPHEPVPSQPDPELTAELQRRRRAYLAGETSSVSVEELESELDDVIAAIHR